jgi:RNA recognition motif-containing protein
MTALIRFITEGPIMNIYVSNFKYSTTEFHLEALFRRYGPVRRATIWVDLQTGESKGYGFVEMPDEWNAYAAIEDLDGRRWRGRRLRVRKARTQKW